MNYKTKRITINEFMFGLSKLENDFLLKPNQAKSCYNLKIQKGSLVQGNGLDELELPCEPSEQAITKKFVYTTGLNIKKVWRYKYYSEYNGYDEYVLIIFGSDNKLHFSPLFAYTDKFYTISDIEFNSTPTALNFRVGGRDVMGFCSPNDEFLVWYCDDAPYIVEGLPKFDSICLHNGRLFAIDSTKNYLVRFSSILNPLDWSSSNASTSGGEIELNDFKGSLKNLVSFLDNVYVFRDFGISKISAFVANSNFGVSNIYSTSSKIFCNTACVCGDNIYFLSEDGLYKFDGFNVEKVEGSFSHLFKNKSQENAVTCFFDGKLYIACNLNFDDEKTVGVENSTYFNNALIEYDLNAKTYSITRGIDVCHLLAVKDLILSKLFVCLNNTEKLFELTDSGKIETQALEKSWKSGKINFENFDKFKTLKEVYITCFYDCSLVLTTEKSTRTYLIKGSEKIQRIRVNQKGKYFSFELNSTQEQTHISNIQMVFNVEE